MTHATASAVTAEPTPDALLIEQSLALPERFAALFDRHFADIHGYAARRLGSDKRVRPECRTLARAALRKRPPSLAMRQRGLTLLSWVTKGSDPFVSGLRASPSSSTRPGTGR
jgi:hypothetical protein